MKTDISIEAISYLTGKPVVICIRNGIIFSVTDIDSSSKTEKYLFVSPGLIDNQINGYAGVDFSGDNLTVEGIIAASEAIRRDGVTTFLPTLITNSRENLIRNFKIFAGALNSNDELRLSVPGFHLEGPYISPEEGYRGCHSVKYIRKPSKNEFLEFQEAAGGKIIQVTIAPEVEGALEFIDFCVRSGICVALGHTNASSELIKMAVEAGAKLSTHLGNGCANMIHRHNNPIWPQLADDRLTASVIADGNHLLPDELRVFYKVKGPDNMILTSDVVYLAGMPAGKYTFLESEVILTHDGKLINEKENCLAGASFSLKTGVANIMNFTGCSLTKAINMASKNAAALYGLTDRGSIAPGKRADLILFERDGNEIIIKETYLNGKII